MTFRPPLVAALFLAAPLGAQAAAPEVTELCVARPSRLVELELNGCRPAALAVEEQVAGTRVWWLRPYMLSVADSNPGVLLRARVVRERDLEIPQTFGVWRENGGEEEFFFASSDGRMCEAFDGVEETLLLAHPPCCDVIPPVSVPCLVETDELAATPPHLLARMEELESEEDAEDEDPE